MSVKINVKDTSKVDFNSLVDKFQMTVFNTQMRVTEAIEKQVNYLLECGLTMENIAEHYIIMQHSGITADNRLVMVARIAPNRDYSEKEVEELLGLKELYGDSYPVFQNDF